MQPASKQACGARRRLDHVVIAVHDLDGAGEFYRRLGFQVGTRNQHPWGTDNRLIQFGSSFIELITIGADADLIPPHETRRFSFGAFIRDYLRERQGLAMLVLSSSSAQRDTHFFAESGIGDFETFWFERNGVKADGATTRVAFSLAFASDNSAPHAGFFVCQQHRPENFWDSRFQRHANGASNLSSVALTSPEPEQHVGFMTAFTGAENRPQGGGKYTFPLMGGSIEVCEKVRAQQALLTSLTVQVDEHEAMAKRLLQENIPFTSLENRLVISEDSVFGVEIRFEQASSHWLRSCAGFACVLRRHWS